MTVIERFFEYLEYKELKHTPVEKELGLSNGYLGKMLSRKGTIGDETLQKIFSFFPTLNIVWLMTGKGEMELSERVQNNISKMAGKNGGYLAGNSEKMAGNLADDIESTENFPSDGNPGCKNCKKLEQDIFFLQDVVRANNLSITHYDEENKHLKQIIFQISVGI